MGVTYAKTPTIYQMEATECGAASLSMIFAYFGNYVPLEKMRVETGVSRDGCNAGNIMRAARKYGLECKGFRKEPASLKKLTPPCIIHWNFNHFVVFEGFKNGYAYLNDPASGRRKLTFEELDQGFTGIVLTFQLTDKFEKNKKEDKLIDFVKARLNGQYSVLGQLLYIGLLMVFPGLVLPILTQIFMDEVLCGLNRSWFWYLFLFMAGTLLLKVFLNLYRGITLEKLRNKMALMSSHSFLTRLFRLPIGFFDQRYVGDLVSRVDNNTNVSDFLADDLAETVLNMFVAIFYLLLLLLYSPVLTIVSVISMVANLILMKIGSDVVSKTIMKQQQDAGKLAGAVCAGLSITSTLKASGAENEYVGRILGFSAKSSVTEQNLNRMQQILASLPEALMKISDVLILMLGGLLVIKGEFTVGMLTAFISLSGSFSEPVGQLVEFVQKIQTLKADMSRVQDIHNYGLDPKYEDRVHAERVKKLSGQVSLKGISFGYSRLGKPLVEDFSFELSSGKSIAFVGSSGCGKSTVSKIISGLYQPWEGEVCFDKIPMKQIPPEILDVSVSTVSQKVTLFSGTIRENLTMWNDHVLEKDIINAAKDACIHDVITQKPGAYDYQLSEGAANLSGGQRQRLEIARALATNPTVLIMDEATSALDPIVEKQIIDNIKRRGCTCIIVAHRLSAIRDCDEIIVMKQGKIVQRGSHEQLSSVKGHYADFIANI